jgi:hypothetical protein
MKLTFASCTIDSNLSKCFEAEASSSSITGSSLAAAHSIAQWEASGATDLSAGQDSTKLETSMEQVGDLDFTFGAAS